MSKSPFGEDLFKSLPHKQIKDMIQFITDCVADKIGWKHTLMKSIKSDKTTYRCPDCHSIVENRRSCFKCRAILTKRDLVFHTKHSLTDLFENLALHTNRTNYGRLRRYLERLFKRGYITSYTLTSRKLSVKWFSPYIPRVIDYFQTYSYKYCPQGVQDTDSNDIGVQHGIKDAETGKYIRNTDPYHWEPNWKDVQKERERSARVRKEHMDAVKAMPKIKLRIDDNDPTPFD